MGRKVKKKSEPGFFRIVRSQDHKSHYVIGVIPQITEDDIRLHMYNEIIEGGDGPYYVSTTQIILPRSAASRVADSLSRALKSEGKMKAVETTAVPLDVIMTVDKDRLDKERKEKSGKKKVQKIRIK
ncbi:MAG: hypothetical protein ACMUIG_05705 [Thermoplasmatota archaeon]